MNTVKRNTIGLIIPYFEEEVTPDVIQKYVPEHAVKLPYPLFQNGKRSMIRKIADVLKKEIPVRGFMSLGTIWDIMQNNRWVQEQGGDNLYASSPWFNGKIRYSNNSKSKI